MFTNLDQGFSAGSDSVPPEDIWQFLEDGSGLYRLGGAGRSYWSLVSRASPHSKCPHAGDSDLEGLSQFIRTSKGASVLGSLRGSPWLLKDSTFLLLVHHLGLKGTQTVVKSES